MEKKEVVPAIYVGLTQWADSRFKSTLFPAYARDKDRVALYSQQFNALELRSSKYQTPTASIIEKWLRSVPDDFLFCPLIARAIYESKRFGSDANLVASF